MSIADTDRETVQNSLPIGHWLFAVALLIAEFVLAVLMFDSERTIRVNDFETPRSRV